jgi:hypothetical protein
MQADRPLADRRSRSGIAVISISAGRQPLRLPTMAAAIVFGALQASLDIEYSRDSVGFTWEGSDEMDEVRGDGSAELLDDGSIEIEFAYHDGDEAVLKAKRDTSSTAC